MRVETGRFSSEFNAHLSKSANARECRIGRKTHTRLTAACYADGGYIGRDIWRESAVVHWYYFYNNAVRGRPRPRPIYPHHSPGFLPSTNCSSLSRSRGSLTVRPHQRHRPSYRRVRLDREGWIGKRSPRLSCVGISKLVHFLRTNAILLLVVFSIVAFNVPFFSSLSTKNNTRDRFHSTIY